MKQSLRTKGAHIRFDQQKVLYLTGEENYSHIHLTNGEVILMSRTLKWFEKRWPSFVRVHKHTLINPQHAFRVKRAARLTLPSYLVMRDQTQLLISRRRVTRVIAQLSFMPEIGYERQPYLFQADAGKRILIPGAPKTNSYRDAGQIRH
ncbi:MULTISPECIES: LytTR family DNA-binding domain-containing protein [unclassified Spirosoma]|uniref:LytR/AlgR family response regulator transcription factor n=1 Tax=unclassified Spirosoma TaxID=2621999 RepID=UPI00095D2E2B|nr:MULTISPECIES: LytTR family DNA-binding domain-containing protein [unclassified Spirosoma]MBN8822287.1 LytTR family transcriptional regulator DNA-binding domain-containing protein [Spirosoma sp.]OJW72407.1 MAG: hypothetical protein BGO59_14825 [Spirosoma sp. 48-14]